VWRATDFGELDTNLRINLSVVEAAAVAVRVERKRWACLVSTHLGNNGVSFCGGAWRGLHGNGDGRGSLRPPPNTTIILRLSS